MLLFKNNLNLEIDAHAKSLHSLYCKNVIGNVYIDKEVHKLCIKARTDIVTSRVQHMLKIK